MEFTTMDIVRHAYSTFIFVKEFHNLESNMRFSHYVRVILK